MTELSGESEIRTISFRFRTENTVWNLNTRLSRFRRSTVFLLAYDKIGLVHVFGSFLDITSKISVFTDQAQIILDGQDDKTLN